MQLLAAVFLVLLGAFGLITVIVVCFAPLVRPRRPSHDITMRLVARRREVSR